MNGDAPTLNERSFQWAIVYTEARKEIRIRSAKLSTHQTAYKPTAMAVINEFDLAPDRCRLYPIRQRFLLIPRSFACRTQIS
jgi:hypothetical protein